MNVDLEREVREAMGKVPQVITEFGEEELVENADISGLGDLKKLDVSIAKYIDEKNK